MLSQNKNRPQTAYGGIAVPERNIKSIVREKNLKVSAEENGKLENILSGMNVIQRGSFPGSSLIEHNNDDKFGIQYVNINKKKVLNNWIKDELSNFEKRQDESLKNMEI